MIYFRIPAPSLPNLSLVSSVAVDGIIVAIVAYTIALSMALIFAQKLNYEVDANQELLAQVNFHPETIIYKLQYKIIISRVLETYLVRSFRACHFQHLYLDP